MVSALDSKSNGPRSSPARRHFTVTVPGAGSRPVYTVYGNRSNFPND